MEPSTVKSKDLRTRSQSARFFGVDLNVEPETHSSYTNYQTNYDRDPISDLNEEPMMHSLFVPPAVDSHRYNYSKYMEVPNLNQEPVTNPLLNHIPDIFHRYIGRLNNVKGDGNCGFWSVVVGRGLDENMWPLIQQELFKSEGAIIGKLITINSYFKRKSSDKVENATQENKRSKASTSENFQPQNHTENQNSKFPKPNTEEVDLNSLERDPGKEKRMCEYLARKKK
nr:probable terpene synthase 6 [Tanacetum cinerariifolium]